MALTRRKTYRDFFLKIEPAGKGAYRVEAQAPGGGEGKTTFNSLPSPPPAQPAVDFGQKLFNAVFSGEVAALYVSARREADIRKYGLRLRLRLAGAPALAELPWEYLHNNSDFLALSTDTPLVRYLDLPSAARPLMVSLPLRLLVTVSSPNDLPELDVAREKANIRQALADLINDGKLELEFSPEASLPALQRVLRQASSRGRPFHAWHFIGHGLLDPDTQAGQLALTDASGRLSPADGDRLGTLFHDYPEIRLVLLNACEGARNSRQDPFAGVAASLVEHGIPAVIGMQFKISDEAAIVFSDGFYTSLVDRLPVDAAVTEARRSIFFMPNSLEWAAPVLFMRSRDGVLFRIEEGGKRAEPGRPEKEKCDVFISYSQEDAGWVKGTLLVRLEKAGLEVCIDFRDFRPGAPIGAEIKRAFQTSRKTLLVLTPNYMESAWGDFEERVLSGLDPRESDLRLIPLLKEDCELPGRIRSLDLVNFAEPEDRGAGWQKLLEALGAYPPLPPWPPSQMHPLPVSRPRRVASVMILLLIALLIPLALFLPALLDGPRATPTPTLSTTLSPASELSSTLTATPSPTSSPTPEPACLDVTVDIDPRVVRTGSQAQVIVEVRDLAGGIVTGSAKITPTARYGRFTSHTEEGYFTYTAPDFIPPDEDEITFLVAFGSCQQEQTTSITIR